MKKLLIQPKKKKLSDTTTTLFYYRINGTIDTLQMNKETPLQSFKINIPTLYISFINQINITHFYVHK